MFEPEIHIAHANTGPAILTLSGEHDVATVGHVEAAFTEALDAGNGVVIDLSDATFIDTAILGALLIVHRLRTSEVAVIAPPGSAAARLFELAGVAHVFTVYVSRDAALSDGRRLTIVPPSGEESER